MHTPSDLSSNDCVSICIPTWQAEAFVHQAIECAQNQTHANLEILISVDESTDDTLEVCRRYADRDPRIRVFSPPARIGWTANIKSLLDKVRSEFYAIYFHDDKVSKDWIATLLSVLKGRPDAGAAYCAIMESDTPNPGQAHDGPVFDRLATRLVKAPKGSPLRALTRRTVFAAPIRFPETSMLGYQSQHAYLVDLIAGAPLLYAPETHYFRWNRRDGGVTSKWRNLDAATVSSDLSATHAAITKTVEACKESAERKEILHYGAGLLLRLTAANDQVRDKHNLNLDLNALLPLPPKVRVHEHVAQTAPDLLPDLVRMEDKLTSLIEQLQV